MVVGLGGGIDSTVTAVVACDALGPERVTAVVTPSTDSYRRAENAARALVTALGCGLREIPTDRPREERTGCDAPRARELADAFTP